jgi:hypothetical protein
VGALPAGPPVRGPTDGNDDRRLISHPCAFAHLSPPAIFNFVLPYTYSATYGILAATASLYFLLRHVIVVEQGSLSAAEFGYRGFGIDYGRAASRWIEANYEQWVVIAYLRVLTRRGFDRPPRASGAGADPVGSAPGPVATAGRDD